MRRLDEATAFPVTVLAAPGGYGKSVLLQQYLPAAQRPALVVEMPPRPGDLGAAVRAIAAVAARRRAGNCPRCARSPKSSGRRELDPWRLARSVADLLAGFEGIVLLEDCHNAADVPEFETFLLELVDLCPQATWILTTRDADVVPCATWIAYRRLDAVIRDDDLRLTLHEATRGRARARRRGARAMSRHCTSSPPAGRRRSC